jgi:predicted RNA polymerase sigma factor
MFMCCHPSLTPASAIPLTLRAVAGLTTREIAAAFLVPEATMAQRISRAKAKVAASAEPFTLPGAEERPERLRSVLHVLYLLFNEGYATSGGPDLARADLSGEAIRLTRGVRAALPDDPEVTGLLALVLLTDARRPARTGPHGELIPLAEQDRSRWDRDLIREGVELLEAALPEGPVGPFQLQAAIAAVHAEAATAAETDWAQIEVLYGMLADVAPGPVVTLNHAVAVAMVRGPLAGLALLDPLIGDDRLRRNHRLHAVRAHLLDLAGEDEEARLAFAAAARLATSLPEQRYLSARATAG